MPLNTDLLAQVRAKIIAEPSQFNMSDWYQTTWEKTDGRRHLCGTAACLAGHTVLCKREITLKEIDSLPRGMWSCEDEAVEELGITGEQSFNLFFRSRWPGEFYERTEAGEDEAIVVLDVLDNFVSTYFPDQVTEWQEAKARHTQALLQ